MTTQNAKNNHQLSESESLAIQIMTHYHMPFSFDTINRLSKEITGSFQSK